MALVIFWVALVAAMRTRMALRLGISNARRGRMTDDGRIGSGQVHIVSCQLSVSSVLRPLCSVHAKVLSRKGLGILIHRRFELACGDVVEVLAIADGFENADMLGAKEP